MKESRLSNRLLATVFVALVPWIAIPVRAADAAGTLTGSIVRSADRSPIAGARLHAGDPQTGQLFSSAPAGEDGSFVLAELPPSTYALAVESDGGLYVVETPLAVAPGATRTLNLAVNPEPMNRKGGSDDDDDDGPIFSFKENPLTATLLLLGSVTVIGILLDDDGSRTTASPSEPG